MNSSRPPKGDFSIDIWKLPLLLFATVSGEMNSRLMVLPVGVGVGRKHDSCVRTGLVVYSNRATIQISLLFADIW